MTVIPVEIVRFCDAVDWPPGEPRPAGATQQEIQSAEVELGFQLPLQLRQFLEFLNGPCMGPGGIFGVRTPRRDLDILGILQLYPEWSERHWIPVAGDGCGNYYVVIADDAQSSAVFFVEPTSSSKEPAFIVASDYFHFLSFLLRKELGEKQWPFNKDFVMANDPDIQLSARAPLPWNA